MLVCCCIFIFSWGIFFLFKTLESNFRQQDDLTVRQVLLILFTCEGVVPKLMIRSHIKLIKYTSPPVTVSSLFQECFTFNKLFCCSQENYSSGRRNLIWAHTLLMKCNPMRVAHEYWPLIGQHWSRELNTGLWLVNTLQGQGSINCFRYKTWPRSARQALSALYNIWSDPTWQVLARNQILMRYYQRKNS